MKIYHIQDQHGRTLDLYENKFYENADPTYCLDRAYLEALVTAKKKDHHLELHVVTTIIEEAELKKVDLL